MINLEELEKIKKKALEEHIPIIMDETLEVIEKYLEENKPKKILEIGTAVGYSAICFTQILDEDGVIDTIERDAQRVKEARENIKKADSTNTLSAFLAIINFKPKINRAVLLLTGCFPFYERI